MNLENQYGPVGIDEFEENEDRPVSDLKEQLARKVNAEHYLQQQVQKLVVLEAATRVHEQNRRQEILRELTTEQKRRQEAEREASLQRHRAEEQAFQVKILQQEVDVLSGVPRSVWEKQQPGVDTNTTQLQTTWQDPNKQPRSSGIDQEVLQLQSEIKILRDQVMIHREDWDREHKEKTSVQKDNEQLKAELNRMSHQLGVFRAKVGKLEFDKEMLMADTSAFKDSRKAIEPSEEDVLKGSCNLKEEILNKLSGYKLMESCSTKHQPQYVVNHPPPSYTKLEFKPCAVTATTPITSRRGWTCSKCTLVNLDDNALCEVCGERRIGHSHPTPRQQTQPIDPWMERGPFPSTAYR